MTSGLSSRFVAFVLAGALVGGVAVRPVTVLGAASSGQPVIAWSESALDLSAEPGTVTSADVAFQSRLALTDVTVDAFGEIADFLDLSPSSFGSLAAGQSAQLEVSVLVPMGTALGTYTGALRVFRHGAPIARPLGVAITVSARYLYIAGGELNSRHLARALAWGADLQNDFVETEDDPYDVAATSTHAFWADLGEGKIGRAARDGTDVDWDFVVLPLDWHPAALAATSSHVYWIAFHCSQDCTEVDPGKRIGRVNVDGTGLNHEFITLPQGGGHAIAVSDSTIYWSSEFADAINEANLDGTGGQVFLSGLDLVQDIATMAGYVYWADYADGTIGRANESATSVNPNFIVIPGNYLPQGLAVDASYLYFSSVDGDTIGRATIDGTSVDTQFIPDRPAYDVAVEPGG